MPLVRIDLAKGHPEGFGRAVGEIVYRAMLSEIAVPIDDKFQIIIIIQIIYPYLKLKIKHHFLLKSFSLIISACIF